MLIDWFTVGAQLVNFLVLVFLLKRFLYHPVLAAIDSREKIVAQTLKAAEEARLKAEAEAAEFQRQNLELSAQRDLLFQKARDEAETERKRLVAWERAASLDRDQQRLARFQEEGQRLQLPLSQRVRAEVFAVSRKVLKDLAGVSLEDRMVEVLVGKIVETPGGAPSRFSEVMQGSLIPVVVGSAFGLLPDQEAAVAQALKVALGPETKVKFVLKPELVSGLDLTANGFRVAWGIADEMESLENGVLGVFSPTPTLAR